MSDYVSTPSNAHFVLFLQPDLDTRLDWNDPLIYEEYREGLYSDLSCLFPDVHPAERWHSSELCEIAQNNHGSFVIGFFDGIVTLSFVVDSMGDDFSNALAHRWADNAHEQLALMFQRERLIPLQVRGHDERLFVRASR